MEQKISSNTFSIDNMLSISKILALLIAGIWTIYLYFSFEKDRYKLSVALLENQFIQMKIDSIMSQIQLDKNKIDLALKKSERILADQNIIINDLGKIEGSSEHKFLVDYEYSIMNNGDKKLEVTYVVLHAFKASLPTPQLGTAIEINDFKDTKGTKWKPLFAKAFWYGPKLKKSRTVQSEYLHKEISLHKGGGTSELDKGESSKGSIGVIVRSSKNSLIGFELRIGINDGETDDNRWRLKKIELLKENKKEDIVN